MGNAIFLALALWCISLLTACAGGSSNEIGETFQAPQTSSCDQAAIKDEIIVKWKDGSVSKVNLKNIEGGVKGFMSRNSYETETVEYNYILQIDSPRLNDVATENWGQNIIEAPAVWAQGYYGEGVVVAVIDSGVDPEHVQLRDNIFLNTGETPSNSLDDDGNGFVDDVQGWNFAENNSDVSDVFDHGTHISGIIAAIHENGDVKGIAPRAKILPLRFTDAQGSGNVALAVSAIQYAIQMEATVINASWGGVDCSLILRQQISDLESSGILFVTSAGNEGVNINQFPAYPASFSLSSQVTVAASTENDALARYSNYSRQLVQLSAPGDQIFSTISGGTQIMSGSSMAAGFVSAAAAVLKGVFPLATTSEIKTALIRSVDNTSHEVTSGGRLNLRRAVEELR